MLTSSFSSSQPALRAAQPALHHATGLQAPTRRAPFAGLNLRLHNRSSLPKEQSSSAAPLQNQASLSSQRRVSRQFVFRGHSPRVLSISGNGTRSTQTVQQMHQGGAWEFFSNGAFRFTPAGLGTIARTDLFPIVGTYQQTRNGISFAGSRSSSMLTSRNFASLQGNFFIRNGALQANVAQRTVLINAARINNTPFGNTIDRTVVLNVQMVRVA